MARRPPLSAWLAGAAATALFLSAPQAAPAWGPSDRLDPEFCSTTTVRGNPEELSRLPALPQVPDSGEVPFAPETVKLRVSDAFQVGEGRLGFFLRQLDGRRSPPLGIELAARFDRVDRSGRVREHVGSANRGVGSIRGYDWVPAAVEIRDPGLYRAVLSVFDRSGTRVARYGFYARLLPRVVRPPRVVLNAPAFAPGDYLLARVENFSRSSISYGVPYVIQRWDGMAWVRAPENPQGFIKPLYVSRPGGTGPCLSFWVPKTMPPGPYRFA